MAETRLPLKHRPRRLRRTAALRSLVAETRQAQDDLVLPVFVRESKSAGSRIDSMPGVRRYTVDEVARSAPRWAGLGIPGILLFGLPAGKDGRGSGAWKKDGVVPRAVERIKREAPGLAVMADVCLCGYTTHGHCGVVHGKRIDNDASLEGLARAALAYANAGADVVAPSAMADGQVAAIRQGLDEAGHQDVAIMSYSAKYASAFYGPFRDAAGCAPKFGDRSTYQMAPTNVREALREIRLDLEEGADIVMVKPALAYLDVIRAAREAFDAPLAAYSVSGEYAMLKAAAARGWIDERRAVEEVLTSIRRAGADVVLTYFAEEVAGWPRK